MSETREDRWVALLGDLLHHAAIPGFSYVAAARQCMALADREAGAEYDCNYCDDTHGTVRTEPAGVVS